MKTIKLTVLFLVLMALSGGVVSACRFDHQKSGENGNVIRQTRTLGTFTGIHVGGAFEVYIKQSATTQEVVVETESDLMDYVVTEVTDGVLEIKMKKMPMHWPHDIDVLKVYITCSELKMLDLSGAAEICTQSRINGSKLEIEASGAVKSKLDLAVQELDLNISGASGLSFSGTAGEVRLDASGASEICAYEMTMTNLTVYGSGAVEVRANVTGSLKANMSGACNVRYKGNPRVDVHSSGACEIKQTD